MEKGKLIVVEGSSDGIGKTTQFNLLKDELVNDGNDIITHHFPTYNTFHGKGVEMYLGGELGSPSDLSPYFINELYAHDRAITWYTKLKESYENGKVILLDRYTTSSLIYQTALIEDLEEKKKFVNYVIDFEYKKLGIKEPDCVIFLTAPFDLITKMRSERKQNDGIKEDIHESNLEFLRKVYESALFVAEYLNWNIIECSNNNEMKSIEEIHAEVSKVIKKLK